MSELKYIFSFGQNHTHPKTGMPLKDYWIEIIADETFHKDENETVRWYSFKEKARQAMFKRYAQKWSMQYHPNDFTPEYFPAGCYEKIYLPLPEDLETELSENPFEEKTFDPATGWHNLITMQTMCKNCRKTYGTHHGNDCK